MDELSTPFNWLHASFLENPTQQQTPLRKLADMSAQSTEQRIGGHHYHQPSCFLDLPPMLQSSWRRCSDTGVRFPLSWLQFCNNEMEFGYGHSYWSRRPPKVTPSLVRDISEWYRRLCAIDPTTAQHFGDRNRIRHFTSHLDAFAGSVSMHSRMTAQYLPCASYLSRAPGSCSSKHVAMDYLGHQFREAIS